MTPWPGYLRADELEEIWQGLDAAPLHGRHVLVAGASGCLGGAIAEALCWQARRDPTLRVTVASRDRARLERRFAGQGATTAAVDFSAPLPPDLPPCDWAVHAASPASPRRYLAAPVATLLANAQGLAGLAQRLPADGRLLFLSSGEIYGSPPDDAVPTPESYSGPSDPTGERGCYTEGKRFAEALAMAFHRERGLRVAISRPIHVYGPGLLPDDGRVICDFIANAARGQAIRMLSDGTPRRSFCYISDATRLHLQLLLSAPGGTVCNVGREDGEISVRELAEEVARRVAPVPVEFGAAAHNRGSPQRSCPHMGRAAALFGYAPRVGLGDGIDRLLAHWRREGLVP